MNKHVTDKEVAEQLRIPGSTFPINGTVFPKKGGAFPGEGTIRRTGDDFVLYLTFAVGAEAPEAEGGTYSSDDFWRFEGVIGGNLPFIVEHLSPCGTRHWNNGVTSQEYDTRTISLQAVGFDKLPLKKLGSLLERFESEVKANDGKMPSNFEFDAPPTGSCEPSSASSVEATPAPGTEMTTPSVEPIPESSSSPRPTTPEPPPTSNLEPTPTAIPEPAPASIPELIPAPSPEPPTASNPDLAPAQNPEPEPEPSPALSPTSSPEPIPTPIPEPASASSQEPLPAPTPEPPKPSPYANGTWIHALVPDFPLIHKNGRTEFVEKNPFLGESSRSSADTFSGSFDGIEFGLVHRGEDLNVYLFLPHLTDDSIPVETHERFLTSFLTGLAFATGQHCWPYRVTIRQNGAQLLDKLNAVRKLDRTTLAPFSERIGFNAAVGQIDWQFGDFLGKATQFFNSGSELSEAASQALWLLRSADAKNVPGEITLMSLCVLLESLAGLIFDDKKLSSTQDATAFEEARAELLKWIGEKKPQDGSGLQRFQNMITSARLERAKDKYKAVAEHFGLQWDGLMKEAWAIWEKVRNKGAHDILKKEKEQNIETHFTATGRIAGAINVLVLRLIGYTGIARTSVFEDKHHKI